MVTHWPISTLSWERKNQKVKKTSILRWNSLSQSWALLELRPPWLHLSGALTILLMPAAFGITLHINGFLTYEFTILVGWFTKVVPILSATTHSLWLRFPSTCTAFFFPIHSWNWSACKHVSLLSSGFFLISIYLDNTDIHKVTQKTAPVPWVWSSIHRVRLKNNRGESKSAVLYYLIWYHWFG